MHLTPMWLEGAKRVKDFPWRSSFRPLRLLPLVLIVRSEFPRVWSVNPLWEQRSRPNTYTHTFIHTKERKLSILVLVFNFSWERRRVLISERGDTKVEKFSRTRQKEIYMVFSEEGKTFSQTNHGRHRCHSRGKLHHQKPLSLAKKAFLGLSNHWS